MYYSYGVSQSGYYHIKANSICQDACKAIIVDETIAIAAVADGLGSEKYSDVASQNAVNIACRHCAEAIDKEDNEKQVLSKIKESFRLAWDEIEKIANKAGNNINEYDTTLSLAVLIEGKLYCGHCGDSGIIGLFQSGEYRKITEQQRDDYGNVFPLVFSDKWEFFSVEATVAGVLLATDGILDILFPYLLEGDIYVKLAHYLMEPSITGLYSKGVKKAQAKLESFLRGLSEEIVDDDKTVLIVMNDRIVIKSQPIDYYREPDWMNLKEKYDEKWRKLAYPHLYSK